IDDNFPDPVNDIRRQAERTAKEVIVGLLFDFFLSFLTEENSSKESLESLDKIYK
ncbi:hypothetical protein HHI36_012194, partial [Cryptolaemus montrouzieri]